MTYDSIEATNGEQAVIPSAQAEPAGTAENTFKREYILTDDGYLLIPNDGRMLLVDTGAPQSFGHGLRGVPGVPANPPESMMGLLTIDWLVEHVHHEFHGLIGAEVLRERTLVIDPRDRSVELRRSIIDAGTGVPVRDLMNVPIVDGEVAGVPVEIIFDTGAPLGFVPAGMVEGLEPVDRIAEFYPTMGPFETDVYELPLRIGDARQTLRFGVLPEAAAQLHSMAGLQVLVGLELLKRHRVSIGLRERRFFLEPVG